MIETESNRKDSSTLRKFVGYACMAVSFAASGLAVFLFAHAERVRGEAGLIAGGWSFLFALVAIPAGIIGLLSKSVSAKLKIVIAIALAAAILVVVLLIIHEASVY